MRNDLDAFWMPFTANRSFKESPRLLASAKNMHYLTPEGRRILDGTAGLWCVNAGHCREAVADAIASQAKLLDFAPTFQLAHPQAFEFANRLCQILPAGIDRAFFCNSGSEAVDTALKISLAYQQSIGQGRRTRLIGRERGYHGVGFGGISVGGIAANRRSFGPLLPGTDHLSHTHLEGAAFTRGQPRSGEWLAEDLTALIHLHGAETIAAVIVEPLAGSTGVLPPPIGYLEKLRKITEEHGILLIFDEVITAFGRLGAATAAERFNITPDLITLAKGLTNGAVPMGAVGASSSIYEAIVANASPGIEFFHGYTYSAHPLATAAGLATLDIYERESLFARSKALEEYWEQAVHGLQGCRHVKDVRNLGLVAGIELESRPEGPGLRGMDVFRRCFDSGLLIRITGDIIALSPPLIISIEQIDEIIGGLSACLECVS